MARFASFNVENLFERPRAFNTASWVTGEAVLDAYNEVNELMQQWVYSDADKERMIELLLFLDIYTRNAQGAIRRNDTQTPRWAWLRKNRGEFDRQPADVTQDMVIDAVGRAAWIGWVELATEPVNEIATRTTARVIVDVNADVQAVVEAEDRPGLKRFNDELLMNRYRHVMLVDGNDDRGIDIGILCRPNFTIQSIRSNVDAVDAVGEIFSRDCPQYEVRTPNGNVVHLLLNHFKSQSGGGGAKRARQAAEVRRIANGLVAANQHVIVMGDLNEGPPAAGAAPVNLATMFDPAGPLRDAYALPGFNVGNRPGTFDSCGLHNRLDYILISQSLVAHYTGGGLFREGLWGSRVTRPTNWPTYPEMTNSAEQASDHAAIYIDLNI